MKFTNRTFLHATLFLVIVYFGLLILIATPDYNLAAYSQNQSSLFQTEAKALDDTPAQKVTVGDIDISYKQLGNNTDKPIILITGCCTTMDMWSPTLLKVLSSNRSVIIFDNRGAGESTVGTKKFSISQFANDTVGLLDALKIEKGDLLGVSMGSFISQEIALMYPNRVDNIILAALGCGGKESTPPSPQVIQAIDAITNASLPTQEDIDKITSTGFPPDWFKANPNYRNYIPFPKESVSPEIIQKLIEAIINWSSVGTCDALSNVTQPTLIIVGTEDIWTPASNSLMMADKIPGAWLIQIRDAGHGLMYQYPDKFNNIVSSFLQTVG